jgi:hypothetical protein
MRDTAATTVSRRHHSGVRHRHTRPALLVGAVLFLVGGALLTTGSGAGAATPAGTSTSTPCSLGLDAPDAAAVIGHNFFVANSLGNSVTEVNGTTGACKSIFSGSQYGFDDPTATVASGSILFVANSDGASSSVTKFKPTTTTATVLSGSGYDFDNPIAMAVSGNHLYVLNSDSVVTEINTATGAPVTTYSGTKFGFSAPTSIAASGGEVFVVNSGNNSITAFAPATGVVSIISGSAFQFDFTVTAGVPVAPAATTRAGVLWVTSPGTSTVTEVDVKTLGLLQVVTNGNLANPGPIVASSEYVFTASPPGGSPMISQITRKTSAVGWMMCNTNANYYFNDPQSLVVVGSSLWVVNEGGVSGQNGNVASLTQMNVDSGALIQVVS